MTGAMEIPATPLTPLIRIDTATGIFLMQGVCIPEDGPGFFGPVITHYSKGIEQLNVPGIFRFDLKYFNSSSLKGIYLLLKHIDDLGNGQKDFRVEWVLDKDDADLTEPAVMLSNLISIPMAIMLAA
ncbi:MAG: SiaC family regulatory phosphoprotein [Flavobacteriales bacterium]